MKRIIISAAVLFMAITSYGQQQRSNPALDSLRNTKDPIALNNKLKMLGAGNEEDLVLLMNYYGRSEKSRDSIAKILLTKFPKSNSAFKLRFAETNSEKNGVNQEKQYLALKKDFPTENYDQILFMLTYNFANDKNAAKAIEYLQLTTGRARSSALTTVPGIVMAYEPKSIGDFINKELASPATQPNDRITLLGFQSQLLEKKGDYAAAFTVMKEYYEQSTRKSPEITARYYYLMSKSGGYQEAFPFLEKAVSEGVSEEIKNELKASFQKLNPGKDANVYMAALDKKFDEKYKAEMATKMISEVAPNFTVTDASGKKVSLADFKGKTIVLDFWATWCGPCKRSLPAMQMTVNKYKKDPNVKFLFIHTWEQVADPTADAKKYFKDNNFDLPLYMDVRDVKTKANPAVSAFDVKGIPAKFVIDGNGNIRFKMAGFGGTNEKAVAELTAMIELSRQAI